MSLYNALFDYNEMAPLLLKALALDVDEIPRFRDCFLTNDRGEISIVVYTRTGGGNRKDYIKQNNEMTMHRYYVRDQDDDLDSTYALFYFKIPTEYEDELKEYVKINGVPELPSVRLQKVISDMKDGRSSKEVDRALKVGEDLMNQINQMPDGGILKI